MNRLAVALMLISAQFTFAQITGIPGAVDPNAVPLDAIDLSILSNKKWNCEKMVETRRGQVKEWESLASVTFSNDGTYVDGLAVSGEWRAVDNKFIRISGKPRNKSSRALMYGPYSVYKISDSTLVLGQILTSSGDWKKEYWFTVKKRLSPAYSYRPPLDTMLCNGERKVYDDQGRITAIENYRTDTVRLSSADIDRYGPQSKNLDLKKFRRIKSVRHGEWKTFYPDGKVESIRTYENGSNVGESIEYYPDGRIREVIYHDGEYYIDRYQYPQNSTTQVVERFWNWKRFYIIGYDDCVQFDHLNVYLESRSIDTTEELFSILNLSDKEVAVAVDGTDGISVKEDSFTLVPHELTLVRLHLRIPGGAAKGTIKLSTNEWTYNMPVRSVGYDLTTSDFLERKIGSLPATFFYSRTGDEYQMEINRSDGDHRVIPISKQLNEIALKPGKYTLTIASPEGKKTLKVKIK